jgi:hypothetical protein
MPPARRHSIPRGLFPARGGAAHFIRSFKMKNAIKNALEALLLGSECGGEMDQPIFSEAAVGLQALMDDIRAYDRKMTDEERVPTGDDYNELLMMLLRLDAEAESNAVPVAVPATDLPAVAVATDPFYVESMGEFPFRKEMNFVRTVTYKHHFVLVSNQPITDEMQSRVQSSLDIGTPVHMMKEVNEESVFIDAELLTTGTPTRVVGIDGEAAHFIDRVEKPALELH